MADLLPNKIVALVVKARVAGGYLPVRLDVDNALDGLTGAPITEGMRAISVMSVPVFVLPSLTAGHYQYYMPTAPYTAVDDTV
jgi:hypothetical protein